jgi:4-hydroxybenzoate polyprenyltransferase
LWISRFVEQFLDSDLKVSREERLREASDAIEPRKVALIGVIICGLSTLLIWIQPQTWWLGLLGLALGMGALFWSSLLKRAGSDPLA